MSVSNYERVRVNARFPAMLLLQDLTGKARTIPLHWHRSLELDLITSGDVTVTIDNQTSRVTAPGLILVNSGALHEMKSPSAHVKAVTLLISYDFIKRALPNYDQVKFELRGNSALTRQLITQMRLIGHWYRQRTPGYQLRIGAQLYQILYLITTRARLIRGGEEHIHCDYRIKSTLTTLHADYRSKLTLRQFARHYQLSPTYFSHLFRQEVGLGFRDYLLNLRVEMAENQLNTTSMKIIDIALDNGFSSAQRFIAAFEKIYGLSPTQYRRQGTNRNQK
ncbi:AraC family transcriptional regulator [Lactiplantibacillus garii]|uniref:AraC family transcriptional regulator n=1 Tax=Lactiplantibacillus garii TaxID=2306423 RepID=A0A426DB45_9LACO|nr:helix-turn-helix domain-containing protein [Lactiplantibacillus garii]RRK11812.1 AraC family transcriptional regulator [Lactiplantibacillus garii]